MFTAALIAALAASGAAQAQATAGVSANTIVFGQSAPLSGANAELGNDIRNGALAYFRKVNEAGGVHGRKLELVTLDDANQVPRSEANTKKLVEEQGVFALFGYASATLSKPALPIVEKNRVPFLSPFTGADPMRAFNRYVYNTRTSSSASSSTTRPLAPSASRSSTTTTRSARRISPRSSGRSRSTTSRSRRSAP